MAFSQADLLALGVAIDADYLGLGFLPVNDGANDPHNTNLMNAVSAAIQIERQDVPFSEVARAIVRTEYNAATLADRQWIDLQSNTGLIDARQGSEQRIGLLGIFGAGTDTRVLLAALLTRDGSALESLLQDGTISALDTFTVSVPGQIRAARV